MPSRKVKSHERRRSAKACQTCKRRKEKCDANEPCGRCLSRGVGQQCRFTTLLPEPRKMVQPIGDVKDPGCCTPYAHSPRSKFSRDGFCDSNPATLHAPPLPSPQSIPITDCSEPRDDPETQAQEMQSSATRTASQSINLLGSPDRERRNSFLVDSQSAKLSRLIQDDGGTFMFVGEAATLSFLQNIRHLVSRCVGPCTFTEDPRQHSLVEATPPNNQNWIIHMARNPPPVPRQDETEYFLRWYMRATNCVLNLFNEQDLYFNFDQWRHTKEDDLEREPMSAIFFLIFAIGAQTGPEERDDTAERYFNYGRFLTTVSGIMEDPSTSTVTAYVLITMYLLGASRRNAAFMCLGTAVRAAYALGIHRRDVNELSNPAEFVIRERLWKILRVLDLFMSASLGRPPSTRETRDTETPENYSASNDLCSIFEDILVEVYSKETVVPEVLDRICQHHRRWAKRFTDGLAVDDIQTGSFIISDQGKRFPNIGLYHLKEAYYWTIMLLSRPFLVEMVTNHITNCTGNVNFESNTAHSTQSNQVLVHACVDSAIRTVDLLKGLMSAEGVPKRLPFVINSLFVAGLVLGLAQFGNLDEFFPIAISLNDAKQLLAIFSKHDPVAKRSFCLVEKLQAACKIYIEERVQQRMKQSSLRVGGLFGVLDDLAQSSSISNGRTPPHGESCDNSATFLDQHEISPREQSYIYTSDQFLTTMELNSQHLELLPDLTDIMEINMPYSASNTLFQPFN